LRRLAARLETLRHEADRLLESDSLESADEELPRPDLRVAKPSAPRHTGKSIAQRARDASSLFDTGREELLTGLESQVAKRIAPLLERLDIPRRSDLDDLARRVAALEHRLAAVASATPGKAATPRKKRP